VKKYAWIAVLIWSLPVWAEPSDLKGAYEHTKTQIDEDEQTHRQVLATLYNINKKMRAMSKKRGQLTDNMLAMRGDVQNLAQTIVHLEGRTTTQRQELSRRLSAMYRLNTQVALRLIFSSSSMAELDRNMKYLKRVSDRDYRMIKEYEENLQNLKAQRSKLAQKVERLASLQRDLKRQEGLLVGEQKSKAALLEKLSVRQKQMLSQLQKLRVREDGSLVAEFFEKKGDLISPAEGPVDQDFGFVEDSELKFRLSHKGLFYKTPSNTSVVATFHGRVVFVGQVPGYGWTVIVDHGDHYRTVYASLSSVNVVMDEIVDEGQEIAAAGTSPLHRTNGVYFEIRHFSDAIDPAAWIKDNHSKRVSQLTTY
jgi:septal ring factor EnvC (AmiA/AmiB activator)